jgi:hypothetical protein
MLRAINAHAFENQWHLGAGASGLTYSGDSSYIMPALSLHGAYGLSDVFDVRLETALGMPLSSAKSGSALGFAELVLAYKVDIIEWIPWVGLGAGGFGVTKGLQGPERNALQPSGSLWVGMDYAFSRQWGVGAVFAAHSWVMDSSRSNLRLAATQFGLRIERRFGW